MYDCGSNVAAGVICLNTIVTATPTSVGLSNTYIAVLSGSVGAAVLVIMVISIVSIAIIVYIQRMRTKRLLKVVII